MKSESCTRNTLRGIDRPRARSRPVPLREDVEGVEREAEVGAVGLGTISQACGELVDVPAPGQRLVGDADAERHRQHRQLAQVLDQRITVSPVACAEVDEQASSTCEPSAWHISSIALATSTL